MKNKEYIVGKWYTTDDLYKSDKYLLQFKSIFHEGLTYPTILCSEICQHKKIRELRDKIWRSNNAPCDIRPATEKELTDGLPVDHPDQPDTKGIKEVIREFLEK